MTWKPKNKIIEISCFEDKDVRGILIQDTGCGVDLQNSEELFKPFIRKLELTPQQKALGYGGTGIGLTIVEMIANRIGCEVEFVEPEDDFNTAFLLSWEEEE